MTDTLERPAEAAQDCGPHAEPQAEHRWLERMVGEWIYESEAVMGPGQPTIKGTGRERVRSLGGLWVIGEGEGETPGGDPMNTIITLGFDPAKQRFVGAFVASVMTHLWPYEGTLEGDVLTLKSEGPSFSGDGSIQTYEDIVELIDDDTRLLRSRAPGPDGQWVEFMTARYTRVR